MSTKSRKSQFMTSLNAIFIFSVHCQKAGQRLIIQVAFAIFVRIFYKCCGTNNYMYMQVGKARLFLFRTKKSKKDRNNLPIFLCENVYKHICLNTSYNHINNGRFLYKGAGKCRTGNCSYFGGTRENY